MTSLPFEAEYPMEPFEWVLLIKFDVSSKFDVWCFSMTGDIWIFKLVILLTLNSSKLITIFLLWASQILPYLFIFTNLVQVTVILLSLGKTFGHKKQSKPFSFDKKFKNQA